MKKTKLMERVFSAIENDEKELTQQLDNDLRIACEDGICDTQEYTMKKMSDTEVEIHDKVNDEDTIATVSDENVELTAKECDTKNFDFDYEGKRKELKAKMDALKADYEETMANLKKQWKALKTFSDESWYIVSGGKVIFTGTENECRAEWNEKGYKLPDYMVSPVSPEEVKPEETPSVKTKTESKKKTFSMKAE